MISSAPADSAVAPRLVQLAARLFAGLGLVVAIVMASWTGMYSEPESLGASATATSVVAESTFAAASLVAVTVVDLTAGAGAWMEESAAGDAVGAAGLDVLCLVGLICVLALIALARWVLQQKTGIGRILGSLGEGVAIPVGRTPVLTLAQLHVSRV